VWQLFTDLLHAVLIFASSNLFILIFNVGLFIFYLFSLSLYFPPLLLLYSIYVFPVVLADCILGTPSFFTFSLSTPLSPRFYPIGCHHAYWLLPRAHFPWIYVIGCWLSCFSTRTLWHVKMGLIRCPETSVNSFHTTPRNIPEERRSQLIRKVMLWYVLCGQHAFRNFILQGNYFTTYSGSWSYVSVIFCLLIN
jgi:hypothetical protein